MSDPDPDCNICNGRGVIREFHGTPHSEELLCECRMICGVVADLHWLENTNRPGADPVYLRKLARRCAAELMRMRHALIAIANNEKNEPYSGQFAREILQTVNTSEEDATLVSRLRDYALRLSSETSAYSFMSDDLKKSADELETVRERFRERGQEISALVLELRRVIDEKNSR